ncbi:MAG: hypothetical protein PHW04_09890 [Candidatus Wallbacteria bacterium]|nr:hypothetical protein [Candidatus Wallbacteria bacterium]
MKKAILLLVFSALLSACGPSLPTGIDLAVKLLNTDAANAKTLKDKAGDSLLDFRGVVNSKQDLSEYWYVLVNFRDLAQPPRVYTIRVYFKPAENAKIQLLNIGDKINFKAKISDPAIEGSVNEDYLTFYRAELTK